MKSNQFDVSGMTCAACATHIERNVGKLDGVLSVQVQLLTNRMTVEFDEEKLQPASIVNAVEQAGYGATWQEAASTSAAKTPEKDASEGWRQRLWVSLSFWVPLMYLSMGEMLGLPVPLALRMGQHPMTLALTEWVLTLPILWWNRSYFEKGFRTALRGTPTMDTLVATGAGAALLYGLVVLFGLSLLSGVEAQRPFLHHYPLYVESAATILTLVTLGKYLESLSKHKTTQAIRALLELSPDTATVWRDGKECAVPIDAVQVQDVIVLRPGQRAPVDGVVVEGQSALDESMLTGESMPVFKQVNDTVLSGSVNQTGHLRYKATRVGAQTTLAQLIRLVEEASASKAPISRMADRISAWFVPVVMLIALVAFVGWLWAGASLAWALSVAMSVLVISCPCALGLATPVAIMVGTGKGASNGLLYQSGAVLETTRLVDTVVLDKTGTLTLGKPVLNEIRAARPGQEPEVLRMAAALEARSEHPLAAVVVRAARDRNLSLPTPEAFEAVPGKGVSGTLQGQRVYVGNATYLREQGCWDAEWDTNALALAAKGNTVLFVATAEGVLGLLAVADPLKPDSLPAVHALQQLGLEVVMLTGDRKETAEVYRRALGIQRLYAEVLPADKERVVAELQQGGHTVMMVGDGINDAPALARADVGVAIGLGADATVGVADVVLMRSEVGGLLTAIGLSRAVFRVVRQNLFWAFFYNVLTIPLAAGVLYPLLGWTLHPMVAAAAMSVSSVTVVLNALRLRRFKGTAVLPLTTPLIEPIQPMETKTVHIEGMSCMHCAARVEKALNALEGVEAQVNLTSGTADVRCPDRITASELKQAVEGAGYTVTSVE
jgi:Cu+-exporting ATPase